MTNINLQNNELPSLNKLHLLTDTTAEVFSDAYWDIRSHRKVIQKHIEKITVDVSSASDLRSYSESEQQNLAALLHIKSLLDNAEKSLSATIVPYCNSFAVGRWALSQFGVGPLSTVKLLQHIDVSKARTHENLWAYAGFAPKSGSKNPYNGTLKEACLDLGRSFVKHSANPSCFYGGLYLKEYERRVQLNDQGAYHELAKDESNGFSSERLSLDRIRSQAQRYAIKIFLVHWYTLEYKELYNTEYLTENKNIIPVPS